jgi:hypothetical protein
MKFISRGNRSPQSPITPPLLSTPSPPVTPSPVRRLSFPKTLYLYKSAPVNINAWTVLNPDYTIHVYDDKQGEEFLLEEFGVLQRDIFRLIPDEDIQSKFLGVCLLYVYGGFYSDAGNEPVAPFDSFIESTVDFVTCNSYLSTINFNFNPSFLASYKENPILKNCIDWYVQQYKAQIPYSFLDWNMMRAFTEILNLENSSADGVYSSGDLKIQILKECFDSKLHTVYCEYDRKRVINNSFT